MRKRQDMIKAGRVPYPAEARRTHTAIEFLNDFQRIKNETAPVVLAGRISGWRRHGGVVFVDLVDASGSVQLQIAKDAVPEETWKRLDWLDAGDFIQAAGVPVVTKGGSQSLQVRQAHMLAKSIRALPGSWQGLKDKETRYRQREVDLLLNSEAKRLLLLRTRLLDWLRGKLKSRGFQEVETPILQPRAGGAMAVPFVTHHHALDTDLYLRIAPELYLKRLLVGGFEKIFEIGRNFRNEGIDRDHNPEFTMCELYWAYADYEDLMEMTEEIISALVKDLTGKEEVKTKNGQVISFAPFWQRAKYRDLLRQEIDTDVLTEKDPAVYATILANKGLEFPEVRVYPKLVDELFKKLVRPKLVQPTMVYDFPSEMAPLAKSSVPNPAVAEKFQLIVRGKELINAYTELNDPVEQRRRFEAAWQDRQRGDKEQNETDEDYLRAMEYGLPPAAGWGLGIDRLLTVLTDAPSVRETMAFPLLRPE